MAACDFEDRCGGHDRLPDLAGFLFIALLGARTALASPAPLTHNILHTVEADSSAPREWELELNDSSSIGVFAQACGVRHTRLPRVGWWQVVV